MRYYEFIKESTTTLNKLYNGNFPDSDESFWDEVRPHEFDNELEVKTMPKHKLAIMLQGQYRVEHLDEILDMMDEDQQEILQRYMNDPNLSNKIILLSGDRIIDGNHRALAAAMKRVSINYVDLADLDDQEVTEGFDSDKEYQGIIMSMLEGEDGFKLVAKSPEGKNLGFVEFSYDTDGTIRAEELEVYEKYRGQGIAKTIYDYVKNLGFKIARSDEQTPDGAKFWDKNRPGKRIWEQDVAEGFDKEAEAWREWQLKMLPRKMEMLSRLVKGWVPSEEDHIAAIDAGYDAMKETGDVKDAAKAIADTLKEIQRQQGVAEDTANLPSVLYHATYKPRLKSIKLKGLGAGGKRNWEDSKRGIVYLSLDPNVAESYAETSDMVPEEWLDEIVILKISTAGLDPNKFHIDSNVQDNAGDTVEYHGVIPVSNISLYKQGVAESFDKEADEYEAYLKRTKDQIMRFLAGVRGAPNDTEILDAIAVAVDVMKRTGDIKQAAKALKDYLYNISQNKQGVAEGKQQVERNGIQLNVSIDGATVDIRPMINGNQIGYVVFDRDGETLVADDLAIDEEYRGRGIAKIIYDYLKELGFTVKRSTDQLPAGKAFWDKYKGVQGQVWEDEHVDEMALSTYKTMGDFTKQGPFRGPDKRLVPHPKNIEKATKFFEQNPFDFRLFFSNIKGTGRWSEHGVMSPDQLRKIFGKDAEEIINGSENAINIVYVGNKGDAKVMLTPWMMAHRFGHAIQASGQPLAKEKILSNWNVWLDTSKHFFTSVNNMLEEYYGKTNSAMRITGHRDQLAYGLTPEYNALFNAIGTQRSSRSGQIRRPYEFLYELFAQYLGTGKVTLNPLPANLTYGRKAWGNPTKYMNIKPEYRNETDRKYASEILERDMELMFNDVLSSSVGKIYVM